MNPILYVPMVLVGNEEPLHKNWSWELLPDGKTRVTKNWFGRAKLCTVDLKRSTSICFPPYKIFKGLGIFLLPAPPLSL